MCSCSQKSNISNLPTASLCCAGSITYKCIGKIQNMKVIIYRPQFENVHFLWVNNASTSFFTHFYSINFIYTSYFAWNYFIFTSYMKYFRLWSFSIVTEISALIKLIDACVLWTVTSLPSSSMFIYHRFIHCIQHSIPTSVRGGGKIYFTALI